jgi:hypothetical protein
VLQVPGYGRFHGIKSGDLLAAAKATAPALAADWPNQAAFKADLDWLRGRGYVIVNETG